MIAAIFASGLAEGEALEGLPPRVLELCEGTIACAVALPRLGTLCLFSDKWELYLGTKGDADYFSSEQFPLEMVGCTEHHPGEGRGVHRHSSLRG